MSADLRQAAELLKVVPWRQQVSSLMGRADNVQSICDHVRDEDNSAKSKMDTLIRTAATKISATELSTQALLRGRVIMVVPDAQLVTSPSASGLRDVLAAVQPHDTIVLRPGFYRGPFRCSVPNITIRGEGDVTLLNTDSLPCLALGQDTELIDLKIRQRSREGCAVMVDGEGTVHIRSCEVHATNCCSIEVESGSLVLENCMVSSDSCSGIAVGRASAVGGSVTMIGGSVQRCGQHGFHVAKGMLAVSDAVVSENIRCGIMLEDSQHGAYIHSLLGTAIHSNGECGLFVGRNQVVDTLKGCTISGESPYFVDPKSSVPIHQLSVM